MARYIDADKLIEEGWVLERHGQSNRLIGIKSIADVPTAFDLDKVVQQLEEELKSTYIEKRRCVKKNPLQFDEVKGYARGIANAIEIVRKGGM